MSRKRKTSSRESTKIHRSRSSKRDLDSIEDEKNWFVWMDIGVEYEQGDEVPSGLVPLGRIEFELFGDELPKTCENFIDLCTGEKGKSKEGNFQMCYKECKFHRIKHGYWICGGDITNQDGTGGWSIYGERFDDEGFKFPHEKYSISMCNTKPNDNRSQFFISLRKLSYLDQDHVVFGKVVEGHDIVEQISSLHDEERDNQRKVERVVVLDCGEKKIEVEGGGESSVSTHETPREKSKKDKDTKKKRSKKGSARRRKVKK